MEKNKLSAEQPGVCKVKLTEPERKKNTRENAHLESTPED